MIPQTGEYALRAVVHLAANRDRALTTREIAEATKVPAGYLSKIMQSLGRSRLVTSRRGLGGGFLLTRPPEEISVLDVLNAAGTPLQRIESCPLGLDSHEGLCPVHRLVDDAIARTEEAFAAATIAELLASTGGSTPLCEG